MTNGQILQHKDFMKLLALIDASDDPGAGTLLMRVSPEAFTTFKRIKSLDSGYAHKVIVLMRRLSRESFFDVARICSGGFDGVTMAPELIEYFADEDVKDAVFEVAAAIEHGRMNVPLESPTTL